MNIIISAGGTGGHIYPAIGILNKFLKEEKNVNILYIGTHNRMEKDIIPAMNIRYEELEIYGLSKKDMIRNFKNIFLIKKAYDKCLKIMKDFKPDIVIGVGGYVTMPVIMAAKKLGIKTVLHEQNSIPGKTNKLLSKDVDLVCVSYENSKEYFKKAKKVIYSGNPCGENALEIKPIKKENLGFTKNKKLLVIVSGSLGSVTINNFFKKFLSLISKDDSFEVLYITGKNYYDDFIKGSSFDENVKVVPYFDNLSALFKDTDLIVSRAGAGIIAEILAMEVPSILIPSPYVAGNHQYYNALDLKEKGLSILFEEKDLNEKVLYDKVSSLLNDSRDYEFMKNNLKKINKEKASSVIYKSIMEIINE